MIKISIPVKPFVKKYLIKRYGTACRISRKSFFGLFLSEMLVKKVEKSNPFDSEQFDVEIPEYYLNTDGYTIDSGKLRTIGLALERMFFDDFYHFVDLRLQEGTFTKASKAIETFLKLYEITEDELRKDSMYRNYQRYCGESIKSKKIVA